MSTTTEINSPASETLDSLQQQLQAAQEELKSARDDIAQLERRQKIDALLAGADAVDLPAARLLTEAALGAMDQPDIEMAVTDLRRHKPYLFRRRGGLGGSMSPRLTDAPATEQAAEHASATGSRRDLLTYQIGRAHV